MVRPEVKSGIEFLDANFPRWELEISVPRLNMADGLFCVIGQRFGSYTTGIYDILPAVVPPGTWMAQWSHQHGFNSADEFLEPAGSLAERQNWGERMLALTEEWATVIAARQVGL